MKLKIAIILFVLFLPVIGLAQIAPHFKGSTASITTNGAGTAVDLSLGPPTAYTMTVERTAGATNVVEIDLECSASSTGAFVQIATVTDLTSGPALASPNTRIPCLRMRYNVITVGAGNTLKIELLATR